MYGKHPYWQSPKDAQREAFRDEVSRETREYTERRIPAPPPRVLPTTYQPGA